MNRLFFRFFVLVMLAITVATFVIYFAISRLYGDPLEDIARRQAAAQIFVLEQYVDAAPADEWLPRLNKVREVSEAQFELVPLERARADIPASAREAFDRGELVLVPSTRSFFRRVDLAGARYVGSDSEAIHAQDLPIDVKLALKVEALRYVIVALALLVPIALWSRSHWRGLQQLSRVADDFGSGNLAARAHMRQSDSIYPLAERINAMAGRIEQLLDSQRNLLHSVSHEVRTPIARLEFGLELLRTAAAGDAAGKPGIDRRIDAMQGDLEELKSLVNELLGMAKLDSRPAIECETVDVPALLNSLCAALTPPPARLELDLAAAPPVRADRRLLARALDNLLRNAQKYSNGHVRVALRAGSMLEVAVEDDGPGIPAAERERVFEPFYRLDASRHRATGGFGLGLAIARKAVALHAGSIEVGSSELGGARFTVRLPLQGCA